MMSCQKGQVPKVALAAAAAAVAAVVAAAPVSVASSVVRTNRNPPLSLLVIRKQRAGSFDFPPQFKTL